MNNKRLSTLMLCFITILSSVILSGCASPEVKTSTTTTPQSIKDVTTTSEETKSVEILPDLPDKKFDGYEMVFCVRGDTFNEWESHDIYAEDENGDPINDALYNRNIFLEEKYNIKISQFGSANVAESAKKSITAGSNDYMAIMADTKETATILAAPGLLIDLKTIPYLDLSKDWWDQRSVNQLSIANKLYFMTGDMSIMANDATWIMMFNKPLAENYKFDNVYSDVLDGKWTFDRMYDMMAVVADDLNGDGKMTATDDQWGFATHASSIEGLFFASDSHTVAKDDNDLPLLCYNKVVTHLRK